MYIDDYYHNTYDSVNELIENLKRDFESNLSDYVFEFVQTDISLYNYWRDDDSNDFIEEGETPSELINIGSDNIGYFRVGGRGKRRFIEFLKYDNSYFREYLQDKGYLEGLWFKYNSDMPRANEVPPPPRANEMPPPPRANEVPPPPRTNEAPPPPPEQPAGNLRSNLDRLIVMARAVSIDVSKLQVARPDFADIRSVYKKAALKYHPDKRENKSDVGFKELNNLYENLNTIYSRHAGGGKAIRTTRKELHKKTKTYKKRHHVKTIDKRLKSRKLIRRRQRV